MESCNAAMGAGRVIGSFSYLSLGMEIKRARQKSGVSQAALARGIGTSQAHISKLERGMLNPTVELLNRIASHLAMRVSIRIE